MRISDHECPGLNKTSVATSPWPKSQGMFELETRKERCEILSSGHDMAVSHSTHESQQLWQSAHNHVNQSSRMDGREACEASILAELRGFLFVCLFVYRKAYEIGKEMCWKRVGPGEMSGRNEGWTWSKYIAGTSWHNGSISYSKIHHIHVKKFSKYKVNNHTFKKLLHIAPNTHYGLASFVL